MYLEEIRIPFIALVSELAQYIAGVERKSIVLKKRGCELLFISQKPGFSCVH